MSPEGGVLRTVGTEVLTDVEIGIEKKKKKKKKKIRAINFIYSSIKYLKQQAEFSIKTSMLQIYQRKQEAEKKNCYRLICSLCLNP